MAATLSTPEVLDPPQLLADPVTSPKAKLRRAVRPGKSKPVVLPATPHQVRPAADEPAVDLLLVYSPPTRPAPPRNGTKRWVREGIVYREVSLDKVCRDPYEDTRSFHQYEGMVRAQPYHG